MKKSAQKTTTIVLFLAIIGVIALAFFLNRKVDTTDTTATKTSAANCALRFVITAPATSPAGTPTPTPAASISAPTNIRLVRYEAASTQPTERSLNAIIAWDPVVGASDYLVERQSITDKFVWQGNVAQATVPGVPGVPQYVNVFARTSTGNSSSPSATLKLDFPVPSPTATPIVARQLSVLAKFAGVTKDVGPIKAKVSDGGTIIGDLTFTHTTNGVYKAMYAVPTSYVFPTQASFSVKPEKHVQRVFRSWPVSNQTIDLTSKVFEPGDLPPQDGIVNITDINKVVAILAKPTQTADDRLIADVNYDGVVNAADVSIILSTLSTRPDESL